MMLPKDVKYIAIYKQFYTCWRRLYQCQQNTPMKNLHELNVLPTEGQPCFPVRNFVEGTLLLSISLSALCMTKCARTFGRNPTLPISDVIRGW
jgi:hypothetical protein